MKTRANKQCERQPRQGCGQGKKEKQGSAGQASGINYRGYKESSRLPDSNGIIPAQSVLPETSQYVAFNLQTLREQADRLVKALNEIDRQILKLEQD